MRKKITDERQEVDRIWKCEKHSFHFLIENPFNKQTKKRKKNHLAFHFSKVKNTGNLSMPFGACKYSMEFFV